MKDYIVKRPMLLCGMLCCIISFLGLYFSKFLLPIGIILAVLTGWLVYKKAKPQVVFCLLLCIIMLLSTFYTLAKITRLNRFDGAECAAKLVLCENTYNGEGYYGAVVEVVESESLPNGTKLYGFYNSVDIESGEVFTANIKLKKIDNDRRAQNYSEGIYLTASLTEIRLRPEKHDFILTGIGKVRNYIKTTVFSNMNYSESATVCALLFGDKSYFTNEFYSNVKGAGVSHVMVVSGMHLSILITFFCYFMDKCAYNRFIKAFVVVMVTLALTMLCGFTMSMLRAGITYFLIAVSLLLNRKSTPENTLGAAAVIILIFSPFAMHDLALELSFLSTFGILVIALPVISFAKENDIIKNKIALWFFSSVAITICAMLMTLPLVIYKLGYLSLVAVITNLLISGAVSVVIWLCGIGLILNLFIPFIVVPVFKAAEVLVSYINSVINTLGSLPFSAVRVPQFAAIPACMLIAVIIKILLACKRRHNMIKLNRLIEKIKDEGGKELKWQ